MSRQTDIQQLIINHARRLQKLKEQQALKGLDAEPDLLIEIEDIEAKLVQLKTELAILVDEAEPGVTTQINETKGFQISDEYPDRRLRFGKPFQAPPLPAHFVPRPEVIDALKARLLADSPTTPGILVVSAIHGLGGIGKSTLVAALASDPEVQQRFKDGILWITLGQQPDLLLKLNEWVRDGLGDYNFHPTTVEAAITHLRTLLHDKTALLVVDDVWRPEHAKSFLVGGPNCQMLITTRRVDVAEEVGAALYQMDVMTPAQALALLTVRLGRPLVETEQVEALALAKDIGYLPLVLELAAARIARDITWVDLREALEAEIVRLEALEHPRRRRGERPRLEASLNLSLNALRAEDETAWQAFVWLGVLPEDVQITAPMAATLWEMDEVEAAEMLELLWNDALLLPVPSSILIGKQAWPAYRLHDLLHDLARRLLTKASPEGLGFDLPVAHAILLAYYQKQTQDSLWYTLPDDGYIHTHLTWHMEWAGQVEQIHALLQEETAKNNGWYQVCERLGEITSFLEDTARAWRLVEKSLGKHYSDFNSVGFQCRYALITTSLNDLNLPPELLVALVDKKLWSPVRGLAYARHQKLNPIQRMRALTALAPHLPEATPILLEAMKLAQEIKDEGKEEITTPGIPNFWGKGSRGSNEDDNWTKARVELALQLAKSNWGEARQIVKKLQKDNDKSPQNKHRYVEVNVALATCLTVKEQTDILNKIQTIEKIEHRAKLLAKLIPGLSSEFSKLLVKNALQEVLEKAKTIKDKDKLSWAKTLTWLAPYLSDDKLVEVLEVIRAIENRAEKVIILTRLVSRRPELQGEILREASVLIHEIQDEEVWAEALVSMASHLHLPEELLFEALTVIRISKNKRMRTRVLVGLTPYLPEKLVIESLLIARLRQDSNDRAIVMATFVPYLPKGPIREMAFQEALELARAINDDSDQAKLLAHLAFRWVKCDHPKEALKMAQAIRNREYRLEIRKHLAFELVRRYPEKAWEVVLAIHHDDEQAWMMWKAVREAMFTANPFSNLKEKKNELREFNSARQLAETLIGLASQLPKEFRPKLLNLAQTIKRRSVRVSVLTELAPPNEVWQKEWKAAQAIHDAQGRAEALVELIPHLQSEEALQEALAITRVIQNKENQGKAFVGLVPYLSKGLLPEALEIARSMRDDTILRWGPLSTLALRFAELGNPVEALNLIRTTITSASAKGDRAIALAELVPYLKEEQELLQDVLTEIQMIADQLIQTMVPTIQGLTPLRRRGYIPEVAKLAPKLAELGYPVKALNMIHKIFYHKDDQAKALAETVPHLQQRELLVKAVALAHSTQDEKKDNLLAQLVLQWAKFGYLTEALELAYEISASEIRINVLIELARTLRPDLISKAVEKVWKIWSPNARMEILTALALYHAKQLLDTMIAMMHDLPNENPPLEILVALAPHSEQLSETDLSFLWQKTFQLMAVQCSRPELLAILPELAPMIAKLGGVEAVAETYQAIQDVGCWWP